MKRTTIIIGTAAKYNSIGQKSNDEKLKLKLLKKAYKKSNPGKLVTKITV